jgi:hypothetical protein
MIYEQNYHTFFNMKTQNVVRNFSISDIDIIFFLSL